VLGAYHEISYIGLWWCPDSVHTHNHAGSPPGVAMPRGDYSHIKGILILI